VVLSTLHITFKRIGAMHVYYRKPTLFHSTSYITLWEITKR